MISMCGGARVSKKLATWNVRGFRPRTQEVDALFNDQSLSFLFLTETMQARLRDGTVVPLEFTGTRISMPGVQQPGGAGHPSMGIAFLSKTEKMKRVAAVQCPNDRWQILVVETDRVRMIGIYVRPKTTRADWLLFLAQLEHFKANVRPTIVCGDFNAHHTAWTKGPRDAGGTALHAHLKGVPSGALARAAHYSLHAPDSPTCTVVTRRGISQSTIDLFLVARLSPFVSTKPEIYMTATAGGGSDHVPIAMTFTYPQPVDTRARHQFLPTPYRLRNQELRTRAEASYVEAKQGFINRIRACRTPSDLHAIYKEIDQVVKAPWMLRAARKPARFREGWSREVDALAKTRTCETRRQYAKATTPQQKIDANRATRRITKQIKRILKRERHEQAQEKQRRLRKAANTRDPAAIARILSQHTRAAREAAQVGETLDPGDFTAFFADKPLPPAPVPLQHFTLEQEFRDTLELAIRKAKKGKAPGPDGIPVEIYQICPALFADLFFEILAACGRLATVIPDWDLSILIPIHKKGPPKTPKNHRPLRLILAFKKIVGAAIDDTMRAEAQNHPAQFGFQRGTSALEALVLAIAHLTIQGMHTIAVDQKGAYDSIRRTKLMSLVAERHSPTITALVAMMLQPSTVFTKGDIRRILKVLDVGVTQGGPDSPTLFNIFADLLLQYIERALQGHLVSGDADPSKAFADDLLLQLRRQLNARRALGACTEWAEETGQVFATGEGKSAFLRDQDDIIDPGFQVTGKYILPADAFEYLGVTITATGTTDASLRRRVEAASSALATLNHLRILVRGMSMKHATFVYNTFVVSRWTYAAFLQPFTVEMRNRLDAIDAGFISATLIACRTQGTGNMHSSLKTLRSIARLPSPQLRRQADAHRYVDRLHKITHDEKAHTNTKHRAAAALAALPQVTGFDALVPDLTQPRTRQDYRTALSTEWQRATQISCRPVPPPAPGPFYYPPALRLKDAWAVALASRYHCSTFPLFHRPMPREGPRTSRGSRPKPLYEKAVRTDDENEALATLALLHKPTCTANELAAVTQALRTLRPREKWARQPPSCY